MRPLIILHEYTISSSASVLQRNIGSRHATYSVRSLGSAVKKPEPRVGTLQLSRSLRGHCDEQCATRWTRGSTPVQQQSVLNPASGGTCQHHGGQTIRGAGTHSRTTEAGQGRIVFGGCDSQSSEIEQTSRCEAIDTSTQRIPAEVAVACTANRLQGVPPRVA